MYVNEMNGLGKFKLKKFFKKAISTLKPPHVRLAEMKKEKAKKVAVANAAAAAAAAATPAPQVEPVYFQPALPPATPPVAPPPSYAPPPQYYAPSPPQYYEPPQAPQYYAPQPPPNQGQWSAPAYPQYSPRDLSPVTYAPAMPESEPWYPPDPGIEEASPNTPIVSPLEFESYDTAESDYMEGLAEGGGWGDIFSSGIKEVIDRSKAKREAKARQEQQLAYQRYAASPLFGGGGMSTTAMLSIAGAVGIGALLLLRKRR